MLHCQHPSSSYQPICKKSHRDNPLPPHTRQDASRLVHGNRRARTHGRNVHMKNSYGIL